MEEKRGEASWPCLLLALRPKRAILQTGKDADPSPLHSWSRLYFQSTWLEEKQASDWAEEKVAEPASRDSGAASKVEHHSVQELMH